MKNIFAAFLFIFTSFAFVPAESLALKQIYKNKKSLSEDSDDNTFTSAPYK
ncbi:MAG: hypothetical protein ABI462_00345 [Ignavibacteria bacterium]